MCSNKDACWGSAERLLEVKRKENDFQFSNFKIKSLQNEEMVHRFHIRLQRKGLYNEQYHCGINSVSKNAT